jgi:hypothetical protein
MILAGAARQGKIGAMASFLLKKAVIFAYIEVGCGT